MTSRWEAAVALLVSAWSIRRIVVLGKQKAKLRKGFLKKILVDGRVPDSDPLIQAVAGARLVQAILETRTGKRFDVKPIVVFPGLVHYREPGLRARLGA